MKPRMTLKIQKFDRSVETILATPVRLDVPWFSEPIEAGVDKRGSKWYVTDCTTVAYVGRGRTRKDVIEAATNRLEMAGEAGYLAAVSFWGEPRA
jgi:hypothetical protein